MEEINAQGTRNKNWYDKSYKLMLIVPAIIILFSVVYLYSFNSHHGDIVSKDVSLTGGTTVTVFDSRADVDKLGAALKTEFPDLEIRKISDIRTGGQRGFIFETKEDVNKTKSALENYLGYKLTKDNSSVEFTGSTLSSGFYLQLRNSIIAAFLLMACVVFLIFADTLKIKLLVIMLTLLGVSIVIPNVSNMAILGIVATAIVGLIRVERKKENLLLSGVTLAITILLILFYPKFILLIPIAAILIYFYIRYSIPSFAVISCAFADIIMTIVVVDISGMTLSIAGIIAFLMLIGYSVDTDILLTTRVLKEKEGTINKRIWGAFKTGITMTLTAVAAVGISLVITYNLSETLRQIFTIILIGLGFDIFNTWITNACIVKWYAEAKGGYQQ